MSRDQMLQSCRHYSSSRASAQICLQAAVFVGMGKPKALAMTVCDRAYWAVAAFAGFVAADLNSQDRLQNGHLCSV